MHARRRCSVAYEAGVDQTHLSKLGKGVSYPGLEIIAKLAATLGCEPAELLKLPAAAAPPTRPETC
jgi:transcriptional regulator with XRE-family HTH domain